jgi:hypothetical protein
MTATTQNKLPPLKNAVLEVLEVLESFSLLLKTETAALKKRDFDVVDKLQPEKRLIARQYQDLVVGLGARREEMGKLEMSLREKLIRKRTDFTLLLSDNMRTLENVRHSTQRLVDKILDAARSSVTDEQQTNYSSKGNKQSYKTSMLSLSVDQKL